MALFGGKSLVDDIDAIIDLVNNWNVMHCNPHKLKLNTKKRAHPSSILDNMISTPAKKSKLNDAFAGYARNCLIDLETEARKKVCDLAVEALKKVLNKDLDEKQIDELLTTQLSRTKHGRGEIDLPCFRLVPLFGYKEAPKKEGKKGKKDKKAKKVPNMSADEIAQQIAKYISEAIQQNTGVLFLSNPFSKVECGNGHINIYLTAAYLGMSRVFHSSSLSARITIAKQKHVQIIKNTPIQKGQIIPLILDDDNSYLSPLPPAGERVMVEYSQPNTHKAFHVGHMRNVALGDCLVRLFEHCGYHTIAANYFGDEGAHVAKCIWLLKKQMEEEKLDLDQVEKTHSNLGEWLGMKYAEAVSKLDLKSYTKYPYPGVIVAKVLSKQKHPDANDASKKIPKSWHVVEVEYKDESGETKKSTVICGGTDYEVGNLVPYVPVGEKYKDKVAVKKDMKGVVSEGVIMSALECGVQLPPPAGAKKEESKENESSKKSKKKKKGKKNAEEAPAKDGRIYLIEQFHPEANIGDKLTELGKFDKKLGDVVEIWQQYVTEQQGTLQKIEEGGNKEYELWMRTRQWSLDEFKKIYAWLGARFDKDFFESECSKDSRQLVDEYFKKGIFVKSEGAIGCQLDDKLGFCMLLKSNGSGLYATKDLSLAQRKFQEFEIDKSIYVVDSAQSHHFKQVFATLKKMGYKQADKCKHLAYSYVRLAEGKMATRTGNVVLFSELVDLLRDDINQQYLNDKRKEKPKNGEKEWSEDELHEAERAISVGAIRYGMLNHDNDKEIVFDLKKWTLGTGNTGPYLMYACARVNSIANKVPFPQSVKKDEIDYSVLEEDEVAKQILFELSHFQHKIQDICENTSPSQLCDYLFAICQLFSKWYANKDNSIKDTKDDHLKAVRLQFSQAVGRTIKVGVQLLGITPLERM